MLTPDSTLAEQLPERRKFKFLTCLGRGGFGEVYRATMTNASGVTSDVAVKVLHSDVDPNSQAVQRLRDEGKLLGVLNHPSILRVTDLVVLDGHVTLVTEYIEGADLDECVKAEDRIPLRAVVEVVARVADALDAAYNAENSDGDPMHLVHRDVKPANIRVGKHGEVKLLDFGIASASVKREAKTATHAVLGTLLYMAPERMDREAPTLPPGDIYALGATLFECVVGERMLEELSVKEQYILSDDHEAHDAMIAEKVDPLDAPDSVKTLIKRMMRADADARPTASDLSHECDHLADELQGKTLRRWCKEHPWPDVTGIQGPLVGREVTESNISVSESGKFQVGGLIKADNEPSETVSHLFDTIEGDADEVFPGEATSGRRLFFAVFAASMVLGALLVGVIIIGAGGAGAALWFTSAETVGEPVEPEPVDVRAATTEPVPEPAKAKETKAKAKETKAKAKKNTKTSAKPKPKPKPSGATGSVANTGRVAFELRGGGGKFRTGEVPSGSYEIWADFGTGMQKAGSVAVPAGGAVNIRCSGLRQDCVVK